MSLNVLVVGAGPGGYVSAIKAAQMGAKVRLVEKENPGGVCLNWGCIPTKTLLASAGLAQKISKAHDFGVDVTGQVKINFLKMMQRKEEVIKNQQKGILGLLKKNGVEYVQGLARISSKGSLEVEGSDGKKDLAWDRLILALGTRPMQLPGLEFDERYVLSSNDFLKMEELPESVLIVGGGVIGCEFACILSSLGVKVSIAEAMPRLLPLPGLDHESSKVLLRELKKKGVQVYLQKSVFGWELVQGKVEAVLKEFSSQGVSDSQLGKENRVSCDKILVTVGRSPNTQGIGLQKAGIKLDSKGWIEVDSGLRTSRENIYAVGDALGPNKVMLAHAASYEGLTAAVNAMGGQEEMKYFQILGAIFTDPEVASVGLTRDEALEKGYQAKEEKINLRILGKAQAAGEIAGQGKLVYEQDGLKILGVHLIGKGATELIAEAGLALKMGAGAKDLADTVHAHPTMAELYSELAHKVLGFPLHA